VATQATLPVIPINESVVFTDDFNNGNVNGWTGLGAGAGQATIGADPGGTGQNVIGPTNPLDGIYTAYTLPANQYWNLNAGALVMYMRLRTDNLSVYFGSMGAMGVYGTNSFPVAYFHTLPYSPGNNVTETGYQSPGLTWNTVWGGGFGTTTTFMDYRVQISQNGAGTVAITSSYYDTGSSQYLPLSNVIGNDYTGGILNKFFLQTSGSAGNVYFDSMAITLIAPEPSIGLLLLTGFGLWRWKRQ
jgi:hypothetical protein